MVFLAVQAAVAAAARLMLAALGHQDKEMLVVAGLALARQAAAAAAQGRPVVQA